MFLGDHVLQRIDEAFPLLFVQSLTLDKGVENGESLCNVFLFALHCGNQSPLLCKVRFTLSYVALDLCQVVKQYRLVHDCTVQLLSGRTKLPDEPPQRTTAEARTELIYVN